MVRSQTSEPVHDPELNDTPESLEPPPEQNEPVEADEDLPVIGKDEDEDEDE